MFRFRDNTRGLGKPQVSRVTVRNITPKLYNIYLEFQMILGKEEYVLCISYYFY